MKQTLLTTMTVALLIFTLSACGTTPTSSANDASQSSTAHSSTTEASVQKITAQEARDRIQSGDPLVILDVRTAEEYAEGHIPGAILLPNEEIGSSRPAQLPVLDTEILIYCRSGNRSAQAASKLQALGYTNLSDFGGIQDWTFETERGEWSSPDKAGTLASFSTYDLNGVKRDESIFSGHKLTMINVWATSCGFCLSEMPDLGQLSKEYAEQGVQLVGIVTDVSLSDGAFDQKQVENARDLVAQTGASYLHLLPSSDLQTAVLGEVSGVPTTLFVDKSGTVVGQTYPGAKSKDEWSKIIDSLLAEVT